MKCLLHSYSLGRLAITTGKEIGLSVSIQCVLLVLVFIEVYCIYHKQYDITMDGMVFKWIKSMVGRDEDEDEEHLWPKRPHCIAVHLFT